MLPLRSPAATCKSATARMPAQTLIHRPFYSGRYADWRPGKTRLSMPLARLTTGRQWGSSRSRRQRDSRRSCRSALVSCSWRAEPPGWRRHVAHGALDSASSVTRAYICVRSVLRQITEGSLVFFAASAMGGARACSDPASSALTEPLQGAAKAVEVSGHQRVAGAKRGVCDGRVLPGVAA
jgi:hypothetical protein